MTDRAPTGDSITAHRRLIIAGSGSAGLSAAIYAARANNDPLVFEGPEPGGQLTLTTTVENYPGFPDGIDGPDLIARMKTQAGQFGAELTNGVVDAIDDADRPLRVHLRNGDVYTTDAFIAASGASPRTLDVPGEDELWGYGVSSCATCDGPLFRGEPVLVVGGGDTAVEEARFLTEFAETVHVVHRRNEFRADDYLIARLMEQVEAGDIDIHWNAEVTEICGSPEDGVESVALVTHQEGHPAEKLDDPEQANEVEQYDLEVSAVFLAIGHRPNTEYLEGTAAELDPEGYVTTGGGRGAGQTRTDAPGIFGAGDAVDYYYQQAITAGGMGVQAALDADDYLHASNRGGPVSPRTESQHDP